MNGTYTYKAKDGTLITGIPDDVPKTDPRLYEQYKQMKATGLPSAQFGMGTPQAQTPMMDAAPDPSDPTPRLSASGMEPGQSGMPAGDQASSYAQEFGKGFVEAIPGNLGAVARGAAGGVSSVATMVADPLTNLVNLLLPENMKQLPPSQGVQALLTMAGVPNAETEAQKILQSATSGLAAGGGTALAGKALSAAPGLVGGIGKAMAAQPIQQMAGGMGSGIASETAAQAGAPPAVQFGAGVAGGMAGSGLAGIKATPSPVGPVQEAEKAGVRLMTSDVRQPTTFAGRWLRSASEKIPIAGTGPVRASQQAQRVAAVKDIVRQYGAEDLAAVADDVMDDLLAKRASDLSRWSTAKNEVIDAVSQAAGTGSVPMPATTAKIDESIAALTSLKTAQVKPVIAILDDWKQAIQDQDLQSIEVLRKQIGEAFTAPEMASVRSTGERILSGIYPSVKQDMTEYIKSVGGESAVNKWQVANKELTKMMGELDLGAIKTALSKGEMTPEAIKSILFSSRRSDVEALYRNLSPDGRAAARSAILAKAAQDATVPTEHIGDYISPDKFATQVKKLGDQVGVFFTGEDLKQVEGLVRVLDYTKRAATAGAMPTTGVQLAIPAGAAALTQIFGSGLDGFMGAMAASAGAGGVARIYESKAVRDILTKLPTLKAGGPEEAAMIKRLIGAAQAVMNSPTRQATSQSRLAASTRSK